MNAEVFQDKNYFRNSFITYKSSFPSTNKRIIKLIDPFLNEIKDDNYNLRRRKEINYKLDCNNTSSEDSNNEENEKEEKMKRTKKGKENSDEGSDEIYHLKRKIRVLRKKNIKNESKIKKIFKTINCISNAEKETNIESTNIAATPCLSLCSERLSEAHTDDEFVELKKNVNFDELKNQIFQEITESRILIEKLEKEFFRNEENIEYAKSKYSDDCIPICADIRLFDFKFLARKQMELANGRLFDAIMMDPPWQLSSSQPTRGVAIAYDTLNDNIITELPIDILQKEGFIFIWTINAKFKTSLDLMKKWGYSYHDEIVWVKQTVNGKIAKGHGYYLQHTKETCLVGKKGNPIYNKDVMYDVIFSRRRGQSQKPEEIYKFIEALIPNGYYLEIFGRRNNLRKNWITLGNEL